MFINTEFGADSDPDSIEMNGNGVIGFVSGLFSFFAGGLLFSTWIMDRYFDSPYKKEKMDREWRMRS